MSRGIPVLYIGPPSDAAEFIAASGGGMVFLNADINGVSQFMAQIELRHDELEEMGRKARSYYEKNLSRQAGLEKYLELMSAIAYSEASPLNRQTQK